ncbi:MAG: beta-lactamase family protein [Treponema sp.]|nr:beta-lactamase family protein [Treponema sp.]
MKKVFCSAILFFCVLTIFAQIPLNHESLSSSVSAYVKEREAGLASVAVGVFSNGETVYEDYFGYADIDVKLHADFETVYEWGSVSKLFVWVSVMQLYEQGKIDLEKDIREYISDGIIKKFTYDEKITMLNLMNHTAGFQECAYQNEKTTESDIKPLAQTLREQQPNQVYKPGEYTAYSNWGCTLAAYIVQIVSGMEYASYVHKNILEPLGMKHTAVSATHADNLWVKEKRELLKTYVINSEGREDFGTNVSYVEVYPAGAVISPLSDMMIFAKALANPSSGIFKKVQTHKEFLSPTSYFGNSNIPKNCHGMWTAFYAKTFMGHDGNTNGCSASLLFNPDSQDGIVIMVNECGETAFCYGLPELVFGSADLSAYTGTNELSENDVSPDISGIYMMSRSFIKGFLKISDYTFIFPVFKTDDPNVFKVGFTGKIIYKGNNCFIHDNGNGMTTLLYLSKNAKGQNVLEMMSQDNIHNPFYFLVVAFVIGMFILSVVCVVILIVKGIKIIVRSRRDYLVKPDNDRKLSMPNNAELSLSDLIRQSFHSTLSLIILPVIAVITLCFLSASILHKPLAIVSATLAGVICLFSMVNGVYLLLKKKWFSVIVSFYAAAFILFFQFYNFWSV